MYLILKVHQQTATLQSNLFKTNKIFGYKLHLQTSLKIFQTISLIYVLHVSVSGRDQSWRGLVVTGSKVWTASATTASVSAGRTAGWWWRTPSSCTWAKTTLWSTSFCCSTQTLSWKWVVLTPAPNTESALRTSLGKSSLSFEHEPWFLPPVVHFVTRPCWVLIRSLIIKCSSYRQSHWWSHEINQLAESCDFLKVQRFGGFAPPRENTLTKWSDL